MTKTTDHPTGNDGGMRIGINGSSLIASGAPLAQIVDHAAEAEAAGFASTGSPSWRCRTRSPRSR